MKQINYCLFHYRMAIMQLAVKEEVYIIDVMEFDKTAEGKELLEVLFTKLFTSEDTLRLGDYIFVFLFLFRGP